MTNAVGLSDLTRKSSSVGVLIADTILRSLSLYSGADVPGILPVGQIVYIFSFFVSSAQSVDASVTNDNISDVLKMRFIQKQYSSCEKTVNYLLWQSIKTQWFLKKIKKVEFFSCIE